MHSLVNNNKANTSIPRPPPDQQNFVGQQGSPGTAPTEILTFIFLYLSSLSFFLSFFFF